MNKQELLNAIVKITKETGQGLTAIVSYSNSALIPLLEELVNDGYIEANIIKYKNLPDDCFYTIKGHYNVWKDNNKSALIFTRIYLGRNDISISNLVTINDILKDSEIVKSYSEWLTENHVALKKLIDMSDIILDISKPFTDSEIIIMKNDSCYKNDITITEAISELESKIALLSKKIQIQKKLISHYELEGDNETEIISFKDDIEIDNNKISVFNKLLRFLSSFDGNLTMQTALKL